MRFSILSLICAAALSAVPLSGRAEESADAAGKAALQRQISTCLSRVRYTSTQEITLKLRVGLDAEGRPVGDEIRLGDASVQGEEREALLAGLRARLMDCGAATGFDVPEALRGKPSAFILPVVIKATPAEPKGTDAGGAAP